jgi:hypothetical protein
MGIRGYIWSFFLLPVFIRRTADLKGAEGSGADAPCPIQILVRTVIVAATE